MRSEWVKERPIFCAGEMVALSAPYKGWIYSLVGSQFTWCEIALRKLPKDPEQNFASMMERLTREEELEKA
jgi:hypothetical protein